jgi:hypothetical protein
MINYVTGNVVDSDIKGLKVLAHIVNSSGIWGSGVVIPIGQKWPVARQEYVSWYNSTVHTCEYNDCDVPWLLGEVQFVPCVANEFVVANMLGQKAPGFHEHINGKAWPPIRLEAVEECMNRVAEFAKKHKATIIAPWFGTLRAGSSKAVIKPMIERIWGDCEVVIYDFEEKKL